MARKQIVADMEAEGCLMLIEDKTIMQPFGDRSQVVVEPYLTDQWYVDAKTLAQPAIKAVENGETRFVPGNWDKTYYEWMRNIEPWCVSRQLWWGHRIPAWYGPIHRQHADGAKSSEITHTVDENGKRLTITGFKTFVAANADEAIEQARKYYGGDVFIVESATLGLDAVGSPASTAKGVAIWQDDDVLDTWFSSALWPFSTMGWPGDVDPALKEFYPGAVLVTAFDIIFFWVARMMMQGIHFMGEVPFKDVYIHALVRDEKGRKMSKSLGNAIDPLELVDEFGADALRMTLAAMAAQGRDIKLAKQRVEGIATSRPSCGMRRSSRR